MEFLIEQRIDLAGVNPVYRYDQPMEYGDGGAHRWIVWASKRGEKADLKNLTAKCFVRRAASAEEKAQGVGSVTVIQEADVDAESGSVSCLFDKACYAGVGAIAAVMRVYDAESHVVAAAKLTGVIERNTSDTVYDPSNLIPSLDELLAQISAIEAATKAANEAAAAAKAAAGRAPYIDEATGTWFVWDNDKGAYVDTGSVAKGAKGDPGTTPHIGENGNWFIGDTDTDVTAQGPEGKQGPKGDQGDGLKILGLYATIAALQAAHPTGSAGDAYAVGTENENVIYNWDVDAGSWKNIGALQGPEGPQGEPGNTPYIGANGNWFIGDVDTGIAATGPVGPQGPQGNSYTLTDADKQEIAEKLIDDAAASTNKTYSSKKVDEALNELKEAKANQTEWPVNKYLGTDANGNMVTKDLPTASETVKGGVMVGSGLKIDSNGVLSLDVSNASGVSF